MKRLVLFVLVTVALFAVVGSSRKIPGGAVAKMQAETQFDERILDQVPLANDRINDLQIGDLDGDGWDDLWVSGRNANTASEHQAAWYRNPGSDFGAWPRVEILPGSWKYGDLGDIDRDGDLDIVADNDDAWDGKVYWLENDGSPGNGGWVKHALGVSGAPDQILVSDLNRDGINEVVLIFKGALIKILRRPVDPASVWDQTNVSGSSSGAILAGGSTGDVDADGDLDLVYGNRWLENPGASWANGSEWIGRTIDTGWAGEARSEVGDINSDGRPDIVLTGEESAHGVAWYSKENPRSTGNWTKHALTTSYSGVHSVQLADFNLDGRLDVFVAEMHTSANRRVTVFEQTAAGGWVERVISRVGSHNAKAGDLNKDGRVDLAGKNFEQDFRPRIWINRGSSPVPASWERNIIETDLPWNPVFVDARDLNGDGRLDLVTGGWWYPSPGSAGGDWAENRQTIGGELYNMAVVFDFNGDADLDILGTAGKPNSGALLLADNDGSGRFTVRRLAESRGDFLQGAEAASLIPGQNAAVLLSWHNGARISPLIGTEWLLAPQDLAQPWRLEKLSDITNEEQIAVGDVDGDGDLDIHLGTSWLRNSGGSFNRQDGVLLSNGEPDRVRLADLDGDGDLDAVIAAENTASGNPSYLAWGENRAGGWVEHEIPTSGGFALLSMDVGDIDRDGDIDLVAGEHQGGGRVWLYENLGRGIAWTEQVVDAGHTSIDHHSGTRLHDLDGDRDLDIVSIGWQAGKRSLVVYENTSNGRGTVVPGPSHTPTLTGTLTVTPTATLTSTVTVTATVSPTPTAQITPSVTLTTTGTAEPSSTLTQTPVLTATRTATPSFTPTLTEEISATQTPTPTPTLTHTPGSTSTRTPTPTHTPTPTQGTATPQTLELMPVADTYVRSDYPGDNFGRRTVLGVDGSPQKITYMKFDLTALRGTTIVSAKLKLTVVEASTSRQTLKALANDSWSETALEYRSRPALGDPIGTLSSTRVGTVVEVDITQAARDEAGGLLSLGFDSSGVDGLDLSSREASTGKPVLVIIYR